MKMVALRKCYCLVHPLVLLTFISFISSNDGWKAKAIAENDRPILGKLVCLVKTMNLMPTTDVFYKHLSEWVGL